jgi:hypothetical protein
MQIMEHMHEKNDNAYQIIAVRFMKEHIVAMKD